MVDRVVVLHADDGLSFIADACAVMADPVNETRLVTPGHADLVEGVCRDGRGLRPARPTPAAG